MSQTFNLAGSSLLNNHERIAITTTPGWQTWNRGLCLLQQRLGIHHTSRSSLRSAAQPYADACESRNFNYVEDRPASHAMILSIAPICPVKGINRIRIHDEDPTTLQSGQLPPASIYFVSSRYWLLPGRLAFANPFFPRFTLTPLRRFSLMRIAF